MFLAIVGDTIGFVRPYGFLFKSSGVGGSVANANEASVSMTKFTQSIWTALSGTDLKNKNKNYQMWSNADLSNLAIILDPLPSLF